MEVSGSCTVKMLWSVRASVGGYYILWYNTANKCVFKDFKIWIIESIIAIFHVSTVSVCLGNT